MEVITKYIKLSTGGHTDIINITDQVGKIISESGLKEGSVIVSAIGSTAGVTTVEYEPGLVNHDIASMLDKLAPYGVNYQHNKTWGDDNGAAHLRSSLIGTSYTCPFTGGKLILGTWQQIVFIDFDTRSRNRRIAVQCTGI